MRRETAAECLGELPGVQEKAAARIRDGERHREEAGKATATAAPAVCVPWPANWADNQSVVWPAVQAGTRMLARGPRSRLPKTRCQAWAVRTDVPRSGCEARSHRVGLDATVCELRFMANGSDDLYTHGRIGIMAE